MPKTYENLKQWTRPRNYMGATWEGYYSAGVGQSRDSEALERANFQAMCNALEDCEGWEVVSENHWACGWVEWVAIEPNAHDALRIANNLMARYADYPILDEDMLSRLEDEDCAQTWGSCFNRKDRIDYLRKHSYTAQCWQDVRAAVAGDWCAAANMLHCPSDILY